MQHLLEQPTLYLKCNRPSHWSINKLITANDRLGDTCCRNEMITWHQFTVITPLSVFTRIDSTSFVDHFCYLCLVILMLSRLFIDALWSPAGKRLTSWLLFVMFNCIFVTFPCGILGQVWYLIVLIPDLCHLSYLHCIGNIVTDVFCLFSIC